VIPNLHTRSAAQITRIFVLVSLTVALSARAAVAISAGSIVGLQGSSFIESEADNFLALAASRTGQ
jgi:hypothetical protein